MGRDGEVEVEWARVDSASSSRTEGDGFLTDLVAALVAERR